MSEDGPIEVLVVDDDPILRLDLADRLRRRGFAVFRAGNADQAIRTMERHPSVRAVFSDRKMPDMDGLGLLHLISQRWPGRLLALVSGWSSPANHEMPPGAVFLQKPIRRRDLDSVLRVLAAGIQQDRVAAQGAVLARANLDQRRGAPVLSPAAVAALYQ